MPFIIALGYRHPAQITNGSFIIYDVVLPGSYEQQKNRKNEFDWLIFNEKMSSITKKGFEFD